MVFAEAMTSCVFGVDENIGVIHYTSTISRRKQQQQRWLLLLLLPDCFRALNTAANIMSRATVVALGLRLPPSRANPNSSRTRGLPAAAAAEEDARMEAFRRQQQGGSNDESVIGKQQRSSSQEPGA